MTDTKKLTEKCEKNEKVRKLVGIIESAERSYKPGILSPCPEVQQKKKDTAEYQHEQVCVERNYANDRIFPLETIVLQRYREKHGGQIEDAIIHAGPAADELARSVNALALTIGKDIYFRNNAYRPENEEGRILLAHELTHVNQYEEKRIEAHTETGELEREAERKEHAEEGEKDPMVTVDLDGNELRFRKSQQSAIEEGVAQEIAEWINSESDSLGEEERLHFLLAVDSWLNEV